MPENIKISYEFIDSLGDTRREIFEFVKGTLTLAQINTIANNLGAVIAPILDGAINGADVNIPLSISSSLTPPTVTPVAGSDVNLGATFSFRTESPVVAVPIYLPTYLHANQSKDIPITGATATFTDMVIAGVSDGTTVHDIVNSSGIDIDAIKKAYGTTRK